MLAGCAVHVEHSRGRRFPERPHPYRNDFQRDRDRVIHSRAFRRLEAKTQVFTRRYSDHFRNRLTHTIEVSQISRTIAGALGLNVDLAEALALVHDIGHPPFGHAGEKALDAAMRAQGLFFDHNLHALRIVEDFEIRYAAFRGLNLTFEVREGIIKHSKDYGVDEHPQLAQYLLNQRPPLEAQLIDLADEIAYNTADLDGVGQAIAEVVGVTAGEDLGFGFKTAKSPGVDHAITVALKVVAVGMRRLRNAASTGVFHVHRAAVQHKESLASLTLDGLIHVLRYCCFSNCSLASLTLAASSFC